MFKQRRAILALIFSLVLLTGVRGQHTETHEVEVIEPPRIQPASDEKKPDLSQVVQIVIDRTNEFRKAEGRSAVHPSSKLTATASYFAHYMARTDHYGHTADDQRPAQRAREHGYNYCIVAENIAYQYNSAGYQTSELGQQLFQGWKQSPPHRKNMLDPDVLDTGVAVARSDHTGYYYAVQMFGRPQSKAIQFKIDNEADTTVKYAIGKQSFSLPPHYLRTHNRCRPSSVTFNLPEKTGTETSHRQIEPHTGDRLVITGSAGHYRINKK